VDSLEKIRAVLDANVLVGKHRRPLLAAAGMGVFVEELHGIATVIDHTMIEGGNYGISGTRNFGDTILNFPTIAQIIAGGERGYAGLYQVRQPM